MTYRSDRTIPELLEDIVLWGERIPALLGQASLEKFKLDYAIHLAVWKSVEVIGEASGRLLRAGFEADGDLTLQLRLAYEMRNRLTHGYPGVDLQVLWTTARTSVPQLVAAVRINQRHRGDKS